MNTSTTTARREAPAGFSHALPYRNTPAAPVAVRARVYPAPVFSILSLTNILFIIKTSKKKGRGGRVTAARLFMASGERRAVSGEL